MAVTGLAEVEQVAAGRGHACARLRSGKLVCWGDNAQGQLGAGPAGPARAEPAEAPGGKQAQGLALGSGQTCVVSAAGALSCWGASPKELAPGPARVATR